MSKTRSALGKGLGALIPGYSDDENLGNRGGIELDEITSEVRIIGDVRRISHDGSRISHDGSRITNDGSRITNDGSRITNDAFSRNEPSIRGIEIAAIAPNPQQPRKDFSPENLAELTQSIREHGLIQPITVRRAAGDKFELISGERRIRAAIEAGLTHLPAYIIEVESDRKMLELAIVENVQRVELNPIEEAEAYQRLIEDCGLTQEEVAEKISKDRTSVANFIRLLKLPETIKDSIRAGELGMGHAKAILGLTDRQKQIELWNLAFNERYTVRKLEELVRTVNSTEKPPPKPSEAIPEKHFAKIGAGGLKANAEDDRAFAETPADIRAIESGFQQNLGTQVKIRVKADKSGEIAIQFFSLEEFERLHELLATINTI